MPPDQTSKLRLRRESSVTSGVPYISLYNLEFLTGCIFPDISLINTKPEDVLKFGVPFLAMWVLSPISHDTQTHTQIPTVRNQAIDKRSQGVELRATEKQLQLPVREGLEPRPPVCKSDTLTSCLPLCQCACLPGLNSDMIRINVTWKAKTDTNALPFNGKIRL